MFHHTRTYDTGGHHRLGRPATCLTSHPVGVERRASGSRRGLAVLLGLAAAIALGGCAAPAGSDSVETVPPVSPTTEAEAVQITDAWVKAVDSGMSGAFAVLENIGDQDAELVAAASDAAAMIELHEVAVDDSGESAMRQIDGGLVVPAGERLVLEPGALHLMLMGVTEPLLAGAVIAVALEFADGSTSTVEFVVKEFPGGDEDYDGSGDQ